MADKTQVEVQLIKNELTVPPPDNLIAGDKGAVYIDLIKISTQAEFKRGTLLMSGTDGYVASTQAGLATASGICILCDDITIGENEFAEVPAYFEGDFNDAKVIFPFETESDDHDAIVEAVREPLRKSKILLRHMHE
ncbi:MAG: hypothetical protein II960_11135 [Synergistaceae bacterium]|nr:hypothetical protein [Synergistaceae bacterium]